MDFISNFIKRPMSLVLSDTSMNALATTSSENNQIETPIQLEKKDDNKSTEISTNDDEKEIESELKYSLIAAALKSQHKEAPSNKDLNMPGAFSHSPLNTKASGDVAATMNKSNAVLSSEAACPQQTIPAAGTANFELNSMSKDFEKNANSRVDPLHNAVETKRFSNRFIGLTEFDEADIPELANNLGEMCDDPLKITFDDDLIANFSANIETTFNSSNCQKSDSTSELAQLQIPGSDPETALSSDNEIYAECLSYRDSELNYELALEMSDTDHYRSALNTNENTASEDDNLNITMENKIGTEPINTDHLTPTSNAEIKVSAMEYPEFEPMDVDMNSTLEMSNYSNNSTLEMNHVFGKQKIDSKEPSSEKIPENLAVEAVKTILKEDSCQKSLNDKEKSISNNGAQEASNPVTVVCNAAVTTNTTQKMCHTSAENIKEKLKEDIDTVIPKAETKESILQDLSQEDVASTSTAPQKNAESKFSLLIDTVISANISPKQAGETSPTFPVKAVNSKSKFPASPTRLLDRPPSFLEQSEYTEYNNAHVEKSPEPLEANLTCVTSEKNKAAGDCYVENSSNEIKEEGNITHSLLQLTKIEHNVSNEISPVANTTTNIGDHASPFSNHNTTFDGNDIASSNLITPTIYPVEMNAEKRRTFNINSSSDEKQDSSNNLPNDIENKRLTFNFSPVTPSNDNTDALYNKSDDKRRTFNVVTPDPIRAEATSSIKPLVETACRTDERLINQPLQQLNITCEAMDVDESFSELPNSSPHSPQRSQLQQFMTLSEMKSLPSSPPLPTRSSPLSMIINRPTICSVATAAAAQILSQSPPLPTSKQSALITEDALNMPPPRTSPRQIKKRSIPGSNADSNLTEMLSAKEQTKSNSKDEKDIFIEKFASSPVDEIFASTSSGNPFGTSNVTGHIFGAEQFKNSLSDAEFTSNSNLIFQPSDFDFLLTKGSNNAPVDRNSLLLRFDPLLGVPVPVNTSQQQQQALQHILQKAGTATGGVSTRLVAPSAANERNCLKTPIAEEEQVQIQGDSKCAKSKGTEIITTQQPHKQKKSESQVVATTEHANMSVDVIKDIKIDNDCTKSYEHSNTQSDEKQANFKMDELEKKIKNEVLKTEDIEKKLKEAEQREEALIKRITEKDKTISKMNGVIEAYEKAIAELIAEKEQLTHNYEKQLTEIKADRDSNYHHLTSLETTFSDLHVKYEKSKEMTSQLKSSEEALLAEKRQNLENLRMQEQRYEKMKNHAMQQLEIANKKLESMKKEHAMETTKLKAQLKKEEISRASINEQLQQKSRENEELVKICDELINGQGS